MPAPNNTSVPTVSPAVSLVRGRVVSSSRARATARSLRDAPSIVPARGSYGTDHRRGRRALASAHRHSRAAPAAAELHAADRRHLSQRCGRVRRRQPVVVRPRVRPEDALGDANRVAGLGGRRHADRRRRGHRGRARTRRTDEGRSAARRARAFYAASAREWWAPLLPLRRVYRRNALVAALDKPSEFAGRAIHEWTAEVFRDETGASLSGQYRLMVRTEREKARAQEVRRHRHRAVHR